MAFLKLAKTDQVLEGKILVKKTKFTNIILTRLDGEFLAFEDVCTHDGEIISCGKLEGEVITCPRHFAKFNIRTGAVLAKPATEPLTLFPVRINGDDIEVDYEDAF
ncbi:non-heme iron oxygenase ferredoxin subunit [Leptospira ognonensis]|uniref:Non-heme iron oxygenase ferredoxin subunit n=1 Tax=Leptospira ognonensis TaxID=2484945 RepID=A0A4R9JYL1_9LEPT|nr:non-heme iron oxygenase ferredoxin subunit [Leptospira ognonensis]TGL57281.1 non-heme iron oxygenase ferredoxin subunit [Leptospira ognonensis]